MYNLDAKRVYLITEGAFSFFFSLIITVNMVYQVETVGLNALQLVLVGTLLEITAFSGEVPTGIVADVYSRRLSVIIGIVLVGTGFIVEGLFPVFGAILLAQVIWGLGATFISGAQQAWIADEIGEDNVGPVYMRGAQISQFAAIAGIIISVILASIRLNLGIVAGGAGFVGLAVFLIFVMPENGFQPVPRGEHSTWSTMSETFVSGTRLIRGRPVLMSLMLVELFVGLFSEGFDRLWTAHVLENFTLPSPGGIDPVFWFGVISIVSMMLAIIGTEVARRRFGEDYSGAGRFLMVLYSVMIISIMGFALAGQFFIALALYWSAVTMRKVSGPIFTAWLNLHVESKVRATVISMTAQVNAFGQIAGGPFIGVIGTVFSLRAALFTTALIFLPVLPLLKRATGHVAVKQDKLLTESL